MLSLYLVVNEYVARSKDVLLLSFQVRMILRSKRSVNGDEENQTSREITVILT
jgi:hypothetical protein